VADTMVVVKLKDKDMPRRGDGNVEFKDMDTLLKVFTKEEVLALVNRAIYQHEYQRESHKKRNKVERDKLRVMKEALTKAGIDPKAEMIRRELEGK
jgi:hypothetical protein